MTIQNPHTGRTGGELTPLQRRLAVENIRRLKAFKAPPPPQADYRPEPMAASLLDLAEAA